MKTTTDKTKLNTKCVRCNDFVANPYLYDGEEDVMKKMQSHCWNCIIKDIKQRTKEGRKE